MFGVDLVSGAGGRDRLLEAIQQLSGESAAHGDDAQTVAHLLTHLKPLVTADLYIGLLIEDDGYVVRGVRGSADPGNLMGSHFRRGQYPRLDQAMGFDKPRLFVRGEHKDLLTETLGGTLTRHCMVIPLRTGREIFGFITTYADSPKKFGQREAALAAAYGAVGGYVLACTRMSKMHAALDGILDAIGHAPTAMEAMRRMGQSVRRAFPGAACSLAMVCADNTVEEWRVLPTQGEEARIERRPLEVPGPSLAQAMRLGQPTTTSLTSALGDAEDRAFAHVGCRHVVRVPLRVAGRIIGVFAVATPRHAEFSQADVRAATRIGSLLTGVIEHRRGRSKATGEVSMPRIDMTQIAAAAAAAGTAGAEAATAGTMVTAAPRMTTPVGEEGGATRRYRLPDSHLTGSG